MLSLHLVSNMGSHSTQYALIVSFTYVRWPEDGIRKTETCCDSKIPISYTIVVFLTEKTNCFIV